MGRGGSAADGPLRSFWVGFHHSPGPVSTIRPAHRRAALPSGGSTAYGETGKLAAAFNCFVVSGLTIILSVLLKLVLNRVTSDLRQARTYAVFPPLLVMQASILADADILPVF